MELFLVGIQSECGKIRNRNNSVFGHFSRNLTHSFRANLYINERTLKLVQNGYENDLLKIDDKVIFHA